MGWDPTQVIELAMAVMRVIILCHETFQDYFISQPFQTAPIEGFRFSVGDTKKEPLSSRGVCICLLVQFLRCGML